MEPLVVVAVVVLLVFLGAMLSVLREQYEDPIEDDREFFRTNRPRMWGLVGGLTEGSDEDRPPGRCPVCGTDNDPYVRFCQECDARLPRESR